MSGKSVSITVFPEFYTKPKEVKFTRIFEQKASKKIINPLISCNIRDKQVVAITSFNSGLSLKIKFN